MRQRPDAEDLGQRLPEIGERRARAEVDAGPHARAGDQQRHVLARMIGARRRRIVAVVGGDDQQIVVAQPRQQRGQPRVEPLEVRGVAGDVVAVAVLRVEVDEVGEDQARDRRRASAARRSSMPSSSLAVWTAVRDAAAGEQILDLADRDDRQRRPPSGDRAASRPTAAARSRGGSRCA